MALQDSKTVQSQHDRFVKRIVKNELVYYLSNDDGVANSSSNDSEDASVLPFWSDGAYASRASRAFVEEFELDTIELFNFLHRWLPGMTKDGVLAGTNWDGDLMGREIEPFDLRIEIEEKMSSDLLAKYEARYHELTKDA
jgi:hypothetical protein